VRPTNLINGNVTDFEVFDTPQGSLFHTAVVTRANVAKLMVDLVNDEDMWSKYMYQMPTVYDRVVVSSGNDEL
jgi:hypothetical protein